jgi:hypothetical protein
MPNLTKKIVAFATTIALAVMLLGPAVPARALTAEELQEQIAALQAQLAELQAQLAALEGGEEAAAAECPCTFTRNLYPGMSGDDVKCLQQYLNGAEFKLAESGPGSPGNETTYFGPLTRAAVKAWQDANGVEYGDYWGYFGPKSRAKYDEVCAAPAPAPEPGEYDNQADCEAAGFFWYNDACHEEEEVVVEEGLTVGLADDTPVSTTFIEGQALADLVHFKFTNGDEAEVKVTQLKVKRIGISADTTLSDVYLYQGTTRLTDNVAVSAGYAIFNDPTGLFSIAPGESITIAVKSNIASGTAGQTIGMSIDSADDIVTDASAVNGTFPIAGNLHSIASATLASVSIATATPDTTGEVTPGETDYLVWGNTLTVSNRNVELRYLKLREIGSIDTDDLQNFKLYVDGTQVGETVQMSDDYYVAFDLTASPVTLEPGSRSLEVRADIIGGSGRSYAFSLRKAVDIVLLDTEFGVNITLGGTLPSTTKSQDILEGNMIVTRTTDSPSGNVVKDASNVVLAKYELKAYGEPIKVETLTVSVTSSDASVTELRNGRLYADGVQVGSTRNITAAGTSYSLGSSLIVNPGDPVILEVRADIFDSDGTNNITSGDKIKVILKAGSGNAQAQDSLKLISVPSSDKEGYDLTVAVGTLNGAKLGAYGDQKTVAGVSGYKLGAYVLTAGPGESVNISRFTVGVTTSDALTKLSNLYVKYGAETTSIKGTISSSNSFSVTYNLPANEQLVVEVYADLASTLPENATVTTTLAVSARGADTGTDVSVSAVTGQTITIVKPTLTASLDASRPNPAIVVAESSPVISKYAFKADYADITVKNLEVALINSDSVRSVGEFGLDIDNNGTVDESRYVTGATTTFTSSFVVPAGTTKVVGVIAKLSTVNTDKNNSGDNIKIKMVSYTKVIGGVETIVNVSADQAATSTDQIIRNTKPTVGALSVSSASLGDGTRTLGQFTISADSHAHVSLTTLTVEVTLNDADVASSTDPTQNLKLSNIILVKSGSTVALNDNTLVATTTSNTRTVSLTFSNTSGDLDTIALGDSQTYEILADVSGSAVNDSVSTKITGLTWGDQVATNIDATYVPGIPSKVVTLER